jgi:hypothetical protein
MKTKKKYEDGGMTGFEKRQAKKVGRAQTRAAVSEIEGEGTVAQKRDNRASRVSTMAGTSRAKTPKSVSTSTSTSTSTTSTVNNNSNGNKRSGTDSAPKKIGMTGSVPKTTTTPATKTPTTKTPPKVIAPLTKKPSQGPAPITKKPSGPKPMKPSMMKTGGMVNSNTKATVSKVASGRPVKSAEPKTAAKRATGRVGGISKAPRAAAPKMKMGVSMKRK